MSSHSGDFTDNIDKCIFHDRSEVRKVVFDAINGDTRGTDVVETSSEDGDNGRRGARGGRGVVVRRTQ